MKVEFLTRPTRNTEFLQEMKKGYGAAGEEKIKNGVFGAYMQVDIKNDGPVTIDLDIPPPSKVDKDTENAHSVTTQDWKTSKDIRLEFQTSYIQIEIIETSYISVACQWNRSYGKKQICIIWTYKKILSTLVKLET